MPFLSGVEARLALLQCCGLRIEQRLRVHVAEERLLGLQNRVLDLLVVREVRRNQYLTRFFDLRRASSEIKQQISERQRWAESRAVENCSSTLRRLPGAVVRRADVDLRVVRGLAAADDVSRLPSLEPGDARRRIVLQCDVDRVRHCESAEVGGSLFGDGRGNGGGGRRPRGRRRGTRSRITSGAARHENNCHSERSEETVWAGGAQLKIRATHPHRFLAKPALSEAEGLGMTTHAFLLRSKP